MSESNTRRKDRREAPRSAANGNGHPAPGSDPKPPGLDLAAELGTPAEVACISTAILNSAGEAYQRPVDLPYVQYLIENWDWNAARTLLVNQRPDGSYWLVDGQHRVLAIREKWGDRDVWCYLTHVDGPKEEARLNELVSDGHSRLPPIVLFRGRITRGEPVAVDIDRIVREEGYSLHLGGTAESEFQLTIPTVLNSIYRKGGPERLRAVLAFCRDTWGGQPGFASSHTVTGVAKFFEYYADARAFHIPKLVEVLSQFPLTTVVKEGVGVQAETLGHRHRSFALAMARLYNKNVTGRGTKLTREGKE